MLAEFASSGRAGGRGYDSFTAVYNASVTSSQPSRRSSVKAEIVSVGTELLLGQITDTNAAYLF
ncbi:MAG: hypothetical protein FJX72_17000, partial [Armatimonadetes bacterium]|nr:hypothetical protein [Armatimonadota bacterium]